MKIKLNQIISNNPSIGVNIERIGKNIISINGIQNDIPINLLLPSEFILEKSAVSQLLDFININSNGKHYVKCACATPDFHTGSGTIPVGSVVVTEKNVVIPGAIGTDINCGMRLHHTGLNINTFLKHKSQIVEKLKGDLLEGTRNLPTTGISMQALFTDGPLGFLNEIQKNPNGMFSQFDISQLINEANNLHYSAYLQGDINYAPRNLINRDILRDPNLATLGGGNHFCEFQIVKHITNKQKAFEMDIKIGDVLVMIHTGSRDVGFYIGQRWMELAKQNFPKNSKHPKNKIYAIEGELATEYLTAMNVASHYASLNRILIAELVRLRIKEITKKESNRFLIDIPHNICLQENIGNVHRKGSTPAHANQYLLIPGSMGHSSYILEGLGNEKWLNSASHGVGRNISRNTMSFKNKKTPLLGLENIECITLKEQRMIEEAPSAYKEIGPVIQSQVEEGILKVIAETSPILTFKA